MTKDELQAIRDRCDDNWSSDAAFIVRARADISRLLAEVERLRGSLDRIVNRYSEGLESISDAAEDMQIIALEALDDV